MTNSENIIVRTAAFFTLYLNIKNPLSEIVFTLNDLNLALTLFSSSLVGILSVKQLL